MSNPGWVSRINCVKFLCPKSPQLVWGDFRHFLWSITDTRMHQIRSLFHQLICCNLFAIHWKNQVLNLNWNYGGKHTKKCLKSSHLTVAIRSQTLSKIDFVIFDTLNRKNLRFLLNCGLVSKIRVTVMELYSHLTISCSFSFCFLFFFGFHGLCFQLMYQNIVALLPCHIGSQFRGPLCGSFFSCLFPMLE